MASGPRSSSRHWANLQQPLSLYMSCQCLHKNTYCSGSHLTVSEYFTTCLTVTINLTDIYDDPRQQQHYILQQQHQQTMRTYLNYYQHVIFLCNKCLEIIILKFVHSFIYLKYNKAWSPTIFDHLFVKHYCFARQKFWNTYFLLAC